MEIKLKLKDVRKANQALKIIIDNEELKLDPLLKFKLLGIMKTIEPHIENYETIKNEKIMQYGKETDGGQVYISSEDKEAVKKFNEDMDKVTEADVEVNISKIKAQDIMIKGVSADILIALYPFLEE